MTLPRTRDQVIDFAEEWCKVHIPKTCHGMKDRKSLDVFIVCGDKQIRIIDEEIRDMRIDAIEIKLEGLKRSVE